MGSDWAAAAGCPPEDCGGISGFYETLEARTDPSGPVSNSVREAGFIHQRVNLSPKITANWILASVHSRGGRFHSSAALTCHG